MKSYIIMLAILLVSECSIQRANAYDYKCEEKINSLKWVDTAHPETDAKRNFENGYTKYRALMRYSLYIPGIVSVESDRITKEKDYVLIEGTGDSLCNDEHVELNAKAIKYAEVYNRYICDQIHKMKKNPIQLIAKKMAFLAL